MTGRTQIEVARAQAALGEMPAVAIIDQGHRITIGAEKEVVAVVLVLDARLLDPGLVQLRKTAEISRPRQRLGGKNAPALRSDVTGRPAPSDGDGPRRGHLLHLRGTHVIAEIVTIVEVIVSQDASS